MPSPRTAPPTAVFRAAVVTVAALFVMVVIEVVGLRTGTVGVVLIGFVVLVAGAVLLTGVDLTVAGVYAACAAAFTLSWNGWYVGPIRPGDVLVMVALICFVAASPNRALRTPPWWVKQLAFVILVLVAVQIFFPPDVGFLSGRTVITASGKPTISTDKDLTLVNIGVGLKYIIAVAIVPMAFSGAVRADRRAVRWLPFAFATGCAVSGMVALSDRFGTSISGLLTGLASPGGSRQIGFSDHPNFLAPALVLAFPFAYWMLLAASRRQRIAGLLCMPGILGGVYASGSRGGAVAIVIVVLLSVAFHPRSRVYFGNVLTAFVALAGIMFVAFPSTLQSVLIATRIDNPASTTGSDYVRSLVGAQGVQDFYHSPFIGIGLQVSDEAQEVYLQELAAGGLLLFVAMSIYLLGAITTAFRLRAEVSLAGAVLAALLTTLAINLAEASLTDRYYYVPAAILIALLEHERQRAAPADEPDPPVTDRLAEPQAAPALPAVGADP